MTQSPNPGDYHTQPGPGKSPAAKGVKAKKKDGKGKQKPLKK
jgi:hypothetical protein